MSLSEVEPVITKYFQALYRGDPDLLREVFAREANLYSVTEGELIRMTFDQYRELVAGRPSPESQGHAPSGDIVNIDLSGSNSCVVKAEAAIPPKHFVDLLSMLKIDGEWKIISKVYHWTE